MEAASIFFDTPIQEVEVSIFIATDHWIQIWNHQVQ
jgi:hypothetical protein